jgi:hypothetical protein
MSGIVDQTTMDEREAEVQQRVKASESNEWWLQTLCVPESEREREKIVQVPALSGLF